MLLGAAAAPTTQQAGKMGNDGEQKEYSMEEIATHATKDSTWIVIKDVNDGGEWVTDRLAQINIPQPENLVHTAVPGLGQENKENSEFLWELNNTW